MCQRGAALGPGFRRGTDGFRRRGAGVSGRRAAGGWSVFVALWLCGFVRDHFFARGHAATKAAVRWGSAFPAGAPPPSTARERSLVPDNLTKVR